MHCSAELCSCLSLVSFVIVSHLWKIHLVVSQFWIKINQSSGLCGCLQQRRIIHDFIKKLGWALNKLIIRYLRELTFISSDEKII